MFFKKIKRKNGSTNKEYVTYSLVESYKNGKYYAHKYLASAGKLDNLNRDEIKKLESYLIFHLEGEQKIGMFTEWDFDKKIVEKGEKILRSYREKQQVEDPKKTQKLIKKRRKEDAYTEIKISSLECRDRKTIGSEYVCHEIVKELGMKEMFKILGFTKRQTEIAILLIIGRCVSPGSEQHTIKRIKDISAIGELMGITTKHLSRTSVYTVLQLLNKHNETIQQILEETEKQYGSNDTIVLYDLTNSYFEGRALGNNIAEFGRSKEKRSDCRLVTLGLVVNKDGFPKYSKVYKGNQSEGATFKNILSSLELKYSSKKQPTTQHPLVVMDAGISSEENLKLLDQKGYKYVVVKKSGKVEGTPDGDYHLAKEMKKTNGDVTNTIEIRRSNSGNEVMLECKSKKKNEKEQSILTRQESLFKDKLKALQSSIKKGTIKTEKIIYKKIGILEGTHKRVSQYYEIIYDKKKMEICVKKDEDKAKEYIKKREKYILRSNHTEATDTEIWDIYNTIRKVEDSFKTMKTDLRLRPIFHQKEEYTKAHIFLTVLAYHVVNIVLYKLRKKNENIRWTTFLEDMATQTIGTLNFEEINKKKNSIRVVDQPTERQSKLYEKLQITAEISPNKKLF